MRYAEKLKVMKAGPDEEMLWSSADDFPALVWGAHKDEDHRLGWWLFWTDPSGNPQHRLIAGDEQGEAGAVVRARELLDIGRPGP